MRLLLPLSSILLAAAPLLGASTQPVDRPGDDTFTGTLVAADDRSVTARAANGTLVTFTVDAQSSVPTGLVAGTRVTVRYAHTERGGLRVVREGIASYPSVRSTEPPPRVAKRAASDTARQPSRPMAVASPVPKSPPSLEGPSSLVAVASPVPASPPSPEEQAEATMSLEPETPVRELPDRSTGVTAATASVLDSVLDSTQAAGLVPLRRRDQLLVALLMVLAGFLLMFAARRV